VVAVDVDDGDGTLISLGGGGGAIGTSAPGISGAIGTSGPEYLEEAAEELLLDIAGGEGDKYVVIGIEEDVELLLDIVGGG
jgi:hypothetical protein